MIIKLFFQGRTLSDVGNESGDTVTGADPPPWAPEPVELIEELLQQLKREHKQTFNYLSQKNEIIIQLQNQIKAEHFGIKIESGKGWICQTIICPTVSFCI